MLQRKLFLKYFDLTACHLTEEVLPSQQSRKKANF